MSASDWTEPFTAPNMLDAPARGNGKPSEAVLLLGRLTRKGITLSVDASGIHPSPAELLTAEDIQAIREHRAELLTILGGQTPPRPSLDEQVKAEAELALQTVDRKPTTKETGQAKAAAAELVAWINQNWHGSLTLSDEQDKAAFFDGLEMAFYNAGVLSVIWGLSSDTQALREFLAELRGIEDRAEPEFQTALHRAQFREGEEWFVLNLAAHTIAAKAQSLNSPRLGRAAQLMQAMLTPDKLRPEAPAQAARKENAQSAKAAQNAVRDEIWRKVRAEVEKAQQGRKAIDAYHEVAPLALRWNEEAPLSASGKKPFSWESVPQAAAAIKTHMERHRRKKATLRAK